MSYSLDPAVPLNDSVRRVGIGQLDQAYAALASADRHTGIHDARKCLKRLRSLLLLVRRGLPKHGFKTLNRRIQATAKGLASARDTHALIEALEKLDRELPLPAEVVKSLRHWLEGRRASAERELDQGSIAEATQRLLELRMSVGVLHLEREDFTPLAESLRQSYRSARRAFRQTSAHEHEESFHDWRKGVQRHWRQMQLLAPCWRPELTARAEAARNLSQLLGDDHDIALLTQLVTTPTMEFGGHAATVEFLKQCAKRHRRLRKQAGIEGERLFAEPARSLAHRIETYWSTASTAAKLDRAETRAPNVVPFGGARNERAAG
jgi:CHAD domain-containing protein